LTEDTIIDQKMTNAATNGDEPKDLYIASHSVMQDIVEDAFDDENLNKLEA